MNWKCLFLLALCLVPALVSGDCYMQNPRGSNDRLNEDNNNRNNANRLFDSQNNAAGGYCVGPPMKFYEGSLLTLEWTIQHGCGNPRLFCNFVIQYMCESSDAPAERRIRDGKTTDTITNDENGPTAMTDGEYTYGMHESKAYYDACTTRYRNMGLFIADRESEGGLGRNRREARFTRQNNNGNRHGFECPEERDYYPYWHPTPWRDIAVLADDESHCDFYKKESQNVKDKYECVEENGDPATENNKKACEAVGKNWKKTSSWGIDAPACLKAPWTRQNHLGNGIDGVNTVYNWTLPRESDLGCLKDDKCECVIRMRYNISTHDIKNGPDGDFSDFTDNGDVSPIKDDAIIEQDGYPHELALDTTQFARTFQDRTHVFRIVKRPNDIPKLAKIYNLNVRGKRGNIVQTYPATEYDFVPSDLHVYKNDYIHFQWTGCDNNPGGNAGEGKAKTDRSNFVQIESDHLSVPASDDWLKKNDALFPDKKTRVRMAMLDQPVDDPNQCLTREQLLEKNNNNNNQAEQDDQNCMKLNAQKDPYFDGGLQKMGTIGRFYYMSSRNNNFTNRAHKGSIMVNSLLPVWAIVIIVIGSVFFLLAFAAGAGIWYSRTHPHSGVARVFSKM